MLYTRKGPLDSLKKFRPATLWVVKWTDDVVDDVFIGKTIQLGTQLVVETITEPVHAVNN